MKSAGPSFETAAGFDRGQHAASTVDMRAQHSGRYATKKAGGLATDVLMEKPGAKYWSRITEPERGAGARQKLAIGGLDGRTPGRV
jgi:hypothetical protein